MADPNMKKLFKDAAELAKGLPEHLQEAAFNRALDMFLGRESAAGGAAKGAAPRQAAPPPERPVLGLKNAGRVLRGSVAAFNAATGKVGLGKLDADVIADALEDHIGPLNEGVVGKAIEGADVVVGTVYDRSAALANLLFPGSGDEEPEEEEEDDEEDDNPVFRNGSPGRGGRKSSAKKRPAAKSGGRGRKAAPAAGKAKANREKPKGAGLTRLVTELIALGFFAPARTATQVALYLNRKGIEITARELMPILLRLIQNGLLSQDAHGRFTQEKA